MRMSIRPHSDIRLSARYAVRPAPLREGRAEFSYILAAVLSRLSYSTAPIRLNGQ